MQTNCWRLPSLAPHRTILISEFCGNSPHPSKCEELLSHEPDSFVSFTTAFLSSLFNTNLKSFKQIKHVIRLSMHSNIICFL